MGQPAIFLDRDGVIIENRDRYVRSWADVAVLPGALAALAAARDSGYAFVIVTNQSAVGRGIISRETADDINRRLLDVIRATGGRIDAVYLCPHAPDDGCECRKPLPGMLLRAAREHDLDLARSVMIGDALSDSGAGQAAGVAQSILVRTGRGRAQEELIAPDEPRPSAAVDTLGDALALILSPNPA